MKVPIRRMESRKQRVKEKKDEEEIKASEQKRRSCFKADRKKKRMKGNVSWSTVTSYINAVGGPCVVVFFLFSYVLVEIFRLVSTG